MPKLGNKGHTYVCFQAIFMERQLNLEQEHVKIKINSYFYRLLLIQLYNIQKHSELYL